MPQPTEEHAHSNSLIWQLGLSNEFFFNFSAKHLFSCTSGFLHRKIINVDYLLLERLFNFIHSLTLRISAVKKIKQPTSRKMSNESK